MERIDWKEIEEDNSEDLYLPNDLARRNRIIYLDNAATTKPSLLAFRAQVAYYNWFGNASSQYEIGLHNAHLIDDARVKIAHCIGALPDQIFFTSGGTESNNWALSNAFDMQWIISDIEHPSVTNAAIAHLDKKPWILPSDDKGYVDLECLEVLLDGEYEICCISVMTANNETGAIQPIKKISEIARKYGCLFHTDATQAMGHMHIDVNELGVDMLSASGHKFGAYPGVGFLYIRNPESLAIPFMAGGHQENGLRGGTYNVAGIVGMADALVESQINMSTSRCGELRDLLIRLLRDDKVDFSINTCLERSLPHILNISLQGVRSEEMVSYLDANEIYVSSGSACTSGDGKPSYVLLAMGKTEEEANSAIRVSMSYDTTEDDIRTFEKKLVEGIKLLRR